jgi:hypothetical protein
VGGLRVEINKFTFNRSKSFCFVQNRKLSEPDHQVGPQIQRRHEKRQKLVNINQKVEKEKTENFSNPLTSEKESFERKEIKTYTTPGPNDLIELPSLITSNNPSDET